MTLRLSAQVLHAPVTERRPLEGVGGRVSRDASGFAVPHTLLSSCKTDVAPEAAVTQPRLGDAVILAEVSSVFPL